MYGKIVVIKRTGADGAHFPLVANSCQFGRSNECDIRIQLPYVSREHCRIDIDSNGQALITNLSEAHPVKVNHAIVTVPKPLGHADLITITDRAFRFEFPPGSRHFPVQLGKIKSPKTLKRKSSSGTPILSVKAKPEASGCSKSSSKKPLSPRSENVITTPSTSSDKGKTSNRSPLKKSQDRTSDKDTNPLDELLDGLSPTTFYKKTTPAKVRPSPVASMASRSPAKFGSSPKPAHKHTPTKSARKTPAGSPYKPASKELRKSISDLRRQSRTLQEENLSPRAAMLKKRVSFGPQLSPEHFDKTLPPKTPVKKGATPRKSLPASVATPSSLLKRRSVALPIQEESSPGTFTSKSTTRKRKSLSTPESSAAKTPRILASAQKVLYGRAASPVSSQNATPKTATPRGRSASPTSRKALAKVATPRDRSASLLSPEEATPQTATPGGRSNIPASTNKSTPKTRISRGRSASPTSAKKVTPKTATPKDRSASPVSPQKATSQTSTPRGRSPSPASSKKGTPKTATPRDRSASPVIPQKATPQTATPRGRSASPASSKKATTKAATPRGRSASPMSPQKATPQTATPRGSTSPASTKQAASKAEISRGRSASPASTKKATRKAATPGDRSSSPVSPEKATPQTATPKRSPASTKKAPKVATPRGRSSSPASTKKVTPKAATQRGSSSSPASTKKATPKAATPRDRSASPVSPQMASPQTATPRERSASPASTKKATPKVATPSERGPSPASTKKATPKAATPRRRSVSPASTKKATPKAATPRRRSASPASTKKATPKAATPRGRSSSPASTEKATPKAATPRGRSFSPASTKKATHKAAKPNERGPSPASTKKATPKAATPSERGPSTSSTKKATPKTTTPRRRSASPACTERVATLGEMSPSPATTKKATPKAATPRGRSISSTATDADCSPSSKRRRVETAFPNPIGLKRLVRTPKVKAKMVPTPSPTGLKRLLKTAKSTSQTQLTPSPTGLRRLMRSPNTKTAAVSPFGVARLMTTPKVVKEPLSPSPSGISRLMKTPKPLKAAATVSPASLVSLMKTPSPSKEASSSIVQSSSVTPTGAGDASPEQLLKSAARKATPQANPRTTLSPRITNEVNRLKTPKSGSKKNSRTPKSALASKALTVLQSMRPTPKTLTNSGKKTLTEIANMLSPVGKVKAPPADLKKLVALRAIHGKTVTPRLSQVEMISLKSSTKSKSAKKTPGRRLWSDVVKGGIAVSKTSAPIKARSSPKKTVVCKKAPTSAKKSVGRTPKTPRSLARIAAPTTGHADSPATLVIGKKIFSRSKAALKRKSLAKSGPLSDSPTQQALYAELPDSPKGPGEMFVSPLSAPKGKLSARKSSNLVGLRHIFHAKKTPEEARLSGVKRLMASPQSRSASSPSLEGIARLMQTPEGKTTLTTIAQVVPSPMASPLKGVTSKKTAPSKTASPLRKTSPGRLTATKAATSGKKPASVKRAGRSGPKPVDSPTKSTPPRRGRQRVTIVTPAKSPLSSPFPKRSSRSKVMKAIPPKAATGKADAASSPNFLAAKRSSRAKDVSSTKKPTALQPIVTPAKSPVSSLFPKRSSRSRVMKAISPKAAQGKADAVSSPKFLAARRSSSRAKDASSTKKPTAFQLDTASPFLEASKKTRSQRRKVLTASPTKPPSPTLTRRKKTTREKPAPFPPKSAGRKKAASPTKRVSSPTPASTPLTKAPVSPKGKKSAGNRVVQSSKESSPKPARATRSSRRAVAVSPSKPATPKPIQRKGKDAVATEKSPARQDTDRASVPKATGRVSRSKSATSARNPTHKQGVQQTSSPNFSLQPVTKKATRGRAESAKPGSPEVAKRRAKRVASAMLTEEPPTKKAFAVANSKAAAEPPVEVTPSPKGRRVTRGKATGPIKASAPSPKHKKSKDKVALPVKAATSSKSKLRSKDKAANPFSADAVELKAASGKLVASVNPSPAKPALARRKKTAAPSSPPKTSRNMRSKASKINSPSLNKTSQTSRSIRNVTKATTPVKGNQSTAKPSPVTTRTTRRKQ